MAVYTTAEAALAAISYKLKVFNDVTKDAVAKQILGASPPAPRKQYLSRSLDLAEARLAAATKESKEDLQRQEAERKLKSEAEKAAKTVEIKFEAEKQSDSFEFVAEKVAPVAAKSSQLSKLISSMPKPQQKDTAATSRAQKEIVTIFLPAGNPLKVTVPKVATVGEVIWSSIQQYEEDQRAPPLVRQTRAYILKMAEEDGSVEDMTLKYTDKFYNFGLFFALAPNPEYGDGNSGTASVREPALSRGSTPMDSSSSKRGNTLRKGRGTIRGQKRVLETGLQGQLLKIKMPDGSHTTVRLEDTATADQVLEKCCQKRKFVADRYHLEFCEDGENVPETTTVEQLKARPIELVANSEIMGLDTYMSERKAMQYETFRVVKIKKGFGGKLQERILGIDSDRITNQAPEEAVQARSTFRKAFDGVRSGVRGGSGGSSGVKKGYWLMSDLVQATLDEAKNKQFILVFKDSEGNSKKGGLLTYRYEAETPKLAKKLVAKLTRLLELYNK